MSTGLDPNSFLMGSKTPSAKFPTIGTVVEGVIADEPQVRQCTNFDTGKPEFWDDGNPRMQLVIRIQTDQRDADDPDDEGIRGVYIKSKDQRTALAKAVKAAGATGLEVGGTLAICYTGDGPKPAKGFPPKVYAYKYTKPTGAAATFLDTGAASTDSAQPPW